MNLTLSTVSLWIRLLAILLGTALLFWLSVEDTTEAYAIFFAICVSTLLAVLPLIRTNNISSLPFHSFILAGILAGAAVSPMAIVLMVFKIGLHAHPVPDYTFQQIISVIHRIPIWMFGGFFISVGFGMLVKTKQTHPESLNASER